MNTKRFLLVVGLVLATTLSWGQKIHVIGFANTLDEKIGSACETDMVTLATEIGEIASYLEYELEWYTFEGEQCSKENLENTIGSLSCGPQDIIVFYYTGHGARSLQDDSPFPQMCLKYSSYQQDKFVPVHRVVELLEKKPARFTLVLTDCCNSAVSVVTPKSNAIQSKGISVYNPALAPKYRKLFVDQSGMLVATSSKSGQASGCSSMYGGFFTFGFFESLAQAVSGGIADSWSSILSNTDLLINQMCSIGLQNPYYVLPTSSNGSSGTPSISTTPSTGLVASTDDEMGEVLKPILRSSLSTDIRMIKAKEAGQKYFAYGAKVATVGRNGSTIVDMEESADFLRRLALSNSIHQICVQSVKRDAAGKVVYMTVREIRTQQ